MRKKHRIVQTCLHAAHTASPRGSSQFRREITSHVFQRVVSLRSWVSTVVIKKQVQWENPHRSEIRVAEASVTPSLRGCVVPLAAN